jgi:hypothetical protein
VLHAREEIGCVVEHLGIAVQLGQEAGRLEQRGLIFGQEMAPRVPIEQRLEEDGLLVEAIQQLLGTHGHAATMVARR